MTPDFYRLLAEKATDLIGDGEWHPYEQVMQALIKLVPPGPALRRSERDRIATVSGSPDGPPPPRKRDRPTEAQIYSGQRSIVRDFLKNQAVFEANRSGTPHGSNHDRRIRMIGRHQLLKEGKAPDQRKQLEAENRELRADISRLRSQAKELQAQIQDLSEFLRAKGYGKDVRRIASDYSHLVDAARSDHG